MVPLVCSSRDKPVGVLGTVMSSSGRKIDEHDLATLAAFGREIARRMVAGSPKPMFWNGTVVSNSQRLKICMRAS
jgi:hypothetical protein